MKSQTAGSSSGGDALSRRSVMLRVLLLGLWLGILVAALVSILRFEIPRERVALRSMQNMVEQSVAPGEVLLVDDRLLGWALERGSEGTLRQSVWVLGKDVTVDSLLPRLVCERRREMVVLATPDGELIRRLDAAGFSVAQEVGWVPWDVKGNGYRLLGRGRKRIYFAMAPKSSDAVSASGKVSSGRK